MGSPKEPVMLRSNPSFIPLESFDWSLSVLESCDVSVSITLLCDSCLLDPLVLVLGDEFLLLD
mgnify:CR=1 FL=1